jgi:hypothetical protein
MKTMGELPCGIGITFDTSVGFILVDITTLEDFAEMETSLLEALADVGCGYRRFTKGDRMPSRLKDVVPPHLLP